MKYNVTVNGKLYEVEAELVKKSYAPISRTAEAEPVQKKVQEKPQQSGENKNTGNSANTITCPMPGSVVDVKVKEGQAVKSGDTLLVLEAMKMENEIKSPSNGVIKEIPVKKGDHVQSGDILIVIG